MHPEEDVVETSLSNQFRSSRRASHLNRRWSVLNRQESSEASSSEAAASARPWRRFSERLR